MSDDDLADDRPRKKRRPNGLRKRPKPDDHLKPWQRAFCIMIGLIVCGSLVADKFGFHIGSRGPMSGKLFVVGVAVGILMLIWGIVGRKYGLAEMPEKRR